MKKILKRIWNWIKKEIFAIAPKISERAIERNGNENEQVSEKKAKLYKKAKAKQESVAYSKKITDYITKIAKKYAEKYTYQELAAAKKKKEQGLKVIGDLKENYDDWEALINLDIFTRACHYYRKNKTVGLTRVVKDYDITKWIKTPLRLKNPLLLPNYKFHPPAKKVIILSEKPLEESVYFIPNYPRKISGVKLTVRRAFANGNLVGFPQVDRPVIQIRDAPGTDVWFYKQRTTAENIRAITDDVNQKIVTIQRKKEIVSKSTLFRKTIEADAFERANDESMKSMMARLTRDKMRLKTLRAAGGTQGFFNNQNIFFLILIVVLIVTTIAGFAT